LGIYLNPASTTCLSLLNGNIFSSENPKFPQIWRLFIPL
jgi:hypothetical protein